MGSGGSGVGSNQGVGSNLVPSQGTGSSANQGLNQSASSPPGTTLNSNPIANGTLPSSFGQPFNTVPGSYPAGGGGTNMAPGQTGNLNLGPYGSSTSAPNPYSNLSPDILSQVNQGFIGGGSTQYQPAPGSQYVGSTPPSLDLSTPNWSGPPLNQVIYQGNAYNVPPGYTQSQFGTGPGQLNPMNLPPWAAGVAPGSVGHTNPPNFQPGVGNKPNPENPNPMNALNPMASPAYAQQVNAQMQAANNASNSAYFGYNPDAYPGPGMEPNAPDTMAQAQAWAAQSPANTAQAAQWQTQNTQDAAARAAFSSSPSGTIGGR